MRISAPPATARNWGPAGLALAASVRPVADATPTPAATRHHPDDVLFRIVREGTPWSAADANDMPGFADAERRTSRRSRLRKGTWPSATPCKEVEAS